MEPSWQIQPSHPELQAVATRLELHPGAAAVLLNRGGLEGATAEALAPKLSSLHDPSGLQDLDKAVEMLSAAIANKTPICVYGDYDVDGTTATAVLVETLRSFGATVGYYLPHRILQGYGLHKEAVEEIAQRGFAMIVTVDLGISNGEEVAFAKQLGLDVIVIDHHQVPERLPIADAVINPHRPDDHFPFKPLCAAGVAFHVLIALRRHLRGQVPEIDLRRSLDLVALATVADMVSLTGLNRILVARGIDVLRTGQRPGLAALARVAGVDVPEIDAQALGFRLGPRVNAAGRMGSAMRCVELFLADGIAATDLASRLDQENAARRSVEEGVLHRAERQAEALMARNPAGLLVFGDDWHPGVIGIVASRLVEKYHRPTVVIGQGGKGSGRSVPGLNLLAVLKGCAEHFVKFGGHHAAAGCTMKDGQGEALRVTFERCVGEALGGEAFVPVLSIDAELAPEAITMALTDDLSKVGPYGIGHPEPLFILRTAHVAQRRQVGDGHLKLTLDNGLSAIAFRQAAHPAAQSDYLDLAFTPFVSRFSGKPKVELRVKSLRLA